MDSQLNQDNSLFQSIHIQSLPPNLPPPPQPRVYSTGPPDSSKKCEAQASDSLAARKMQKAGREKLRRDRLNEHFVELGNALDPDRPKNDKATILSDTIQLLKDLTSEVSKLKAECATFTEESNELTREKNDLREEKASLKSDIENLNTQYQQRVGSMFPWTAVDHSVVMAPPHSYPFPMPMPMAPGPIPMHAPLQPYPFFGNQNPAMFHSAFAPYMAPNASIDQQLAQNMTSPAQPAKQSRDSASQSPNAKSSRERKRENREESNDVTTDLELKTPGPTTNQDISSEQCSSKRSSRRESCGTEGSSLSRCSSSRSVQDSSSDCVGGSTSADAVD